jgi:hypothetical protein
MRRNAVMLRNLSLPRNQMPRFFSRFPIVYLALVCAATQIAGGVFILPNASLPALGTVWPMRELTMWLARQAFGVTEPLVYQGNSGDTVFHWIQTAILLLAATVVTAAWSLIDRQRACDPIVRRWFRLFARFALAGQMFYFGMAKVIPTQFPPPPLVTLVEPSGNLSLSAMLWTSIGASVGYEIFTGIAEVLAGLLLLAPTTTPLGALIALADLVLVFVLNLTYDIGLKLISFHLILLALYLLAPDMRRLVNVLVLDRPAAPTPVPPLFESARANRRALVAQLAFGAYLLAIFTSVSVRSWYADGGGGAPKSPLYGIWDVDRLWVDDQLRPAAMNDYDRRWRRVIFDTPDMVIVQRLDDSFAHYPASLDDTARRLMLRKKNSQRWRASFTYDRPAADRLVLDGEMDGHAIRAELQRVEPDTFRLLNSSFRWIHPVDD